MSNSYTSIKRVMLVKEGSIHSRPQITSTAEGVRFFKKYWQDNPGNDQERFVIACLNTKNRPICVVVITMGTLDASLVHAREVFKPAIIEGSSSIIISHNHPGGDPTPSSQDWTVFTKLQEQGKILGIEVLDSIVYGDGTDEAFSMREGH
jgi:DNA repair protein RadC